MAWQWHQLDHTQIICISIQTDDYAITSSLNFITGRNLVLTTNQQCQSTEGKTITIPPTPQPFYGPFSGTPRVSRCQKRTSGLYGARGRLTEADTQTIRLVATPSRLTSAHLHHSPIFFSGRMSFLPPNQQCQST